MIQFQLREDDVEIAGRVVNERGEGVAGADVTVLERLDVFGGAAISATAFTGLDARLSRYAYLVSLLPPSIANDLGLNVSLVLSLIHI